MATSTARAPTLAHADISHRPTNLPPRSPIPRSSSPATSAALNALRSTPRSASLDWARPRQHSPVVALVPPPRPSSSTSTRPPLPSLPPADAPVRPSSPPLPKVKREAYVVPPIPPFRGAAAGSSAPTVVEAAPAVAPRAGPSAVPASLAEADQAPRRVSYPLVFSLPRQDQRAGPSGGRASCSAAVTTGLGIAGVGVGAGGAREALVIERVGEGPAAAASRRVDLEDGAAATAGDGGVRRGSLKRVLISDGEDELAAVRRPASSGDDGMVASSSFPPPRRPPPAPPSLVHRQSDPVVATHRPRIGSSSPDSSSAANKRRRTSRPTPLDSLATTATDLLAAAPTPSTSTATQGGIPLSTLVLGQPVQEQHQRELERRRSSASQAPSAPQAPAPVPSSRRGSVVASQQDPAAGSSGLAKRRGHRPPTVATGPPLPSGPATHRGSFSAVHGDAPFSALRSAPVDIPSVLVGSPMEATFAARARERASASGAELPPMRNGGGPSSTAREPGPPPRRQSQGAVHPQPPLVSSSSYYIRPNQPLGPGHSFPPPPPATATSPRSSAPPPKDQGRHVRLPSLTRSTGSSRGPHQHHHVSHSSQSSMQGYHLHHPQLHAHQHASSSSSSWHGPPSGGPLSPLPPLGESMPAPGAPGGPPLPSPAFTTLPPHSAGLAPHAPYHQGARPGSSHGAPLPPVHPPTSSHGQHVHPTAPSPSTKQAFLSLFSNFYDSLSDSRVLTSSLDQQLVRAAQLLTTLQQAEQALDAAVLDVRREGERRWAAIEDRLVRLEGGAGRVGGGSTSLEDRLAKLERLLLDREAADGVRRHSGASTTSSGGVADSEASAGAGAPEARDEDMEG
ncbi:hypothetical protein JCM3775_002068 [Rhodotorula graminis]|uniref:Uncharacterized protein n=1 Tax=Rhodotorula graminis (strain WP1) TaxID=578459 RepID=A0A0P9F163_RHOGW|nr:uncharacterized protein RHOBADRAFT_55030 [Rhodotorula graminis WP1]KPV73258.1 hypothetical protein RHOBADRAFT_55030 [Rhodotorula graminis WP1]